MLTRTSQLPSRPAPTALAMYKLSISSSIDLPFFSNQHSRIPPSNYVILGDALKTDHCGGKTVLHKTWTLSFAPGALSTFGVPSTGGQPTKRLQSEDLPCGPGGSYWDKLEGGYKPLLVPPENATQSWLGLNASDEIGRCSISSPIWEPPGFAVSAIEISRADE